MLVKTKLLQMKNFVKTIEKLSFTNCRKRQIRGRKCCKKFSFAKYTPHINEILNKDTS